MWTSRSIPPNCGEATSTEPPTSGSSRWNPDRSMTDRLSLCSREPAQASVDCRSGGAGAAGGVIRIALRSIRARRGTIDQMEFASLVAAGAFRIGSHPEGPHRDGHTLVLDRSVSWGKAAPDNKSLPTNNFFVFSPVSIIAPALLSDDLPRIFAATNYTQKTLGISGIGTSLGGSDDHATWEIGPRVGLHDKLAALSGSVRTNVQRTARRPVWNIRNREYRQLD